MKRFKEKFVKETQKRAELEKPGRVKGGLAQIFKLN